MSFTNKMTDNLSFDDVVNKWKLSKEMIKKYEKEEEYYKKIIEKYMNKKEVDKIESKYFCVKRSMQTRSFIDRENLSADIWNKYKRSSSFYVFRITNKNEK
jgi:hypothetical protein